VALSELFAHARVSCRSRFVVILALFAIAASLSGCGSPALSPPSAEVVSGKVFGGQQPVTAAFIQLYAAGTTGDGSPATPLLASEVTTSDGSGNSTNANANSGNSFNALPAGAFNITGDYTCPSASTPVYLVATGGNPGLGAGLTNPNLALMAALGPCGNLTASTYITLNELTTVASTASLGSFTTGYASVGSATTDFAALNTAFANVNQLVNIATGTAPGPSLPAGSQAPVATINTLAGILAACVNSAGGSAGSPTACGQLFTAVTAPGSTPPANTIAAALNLIAYPTQNLAATFSLLSPTAPFQPTLASAPPSWTIDLAPTGSSAPATVVWPAMYGLDMYLPFTDQSGSRLTDVTGNGHDGVLSGSGATAAYPGLVGITPNNQTVTMPNASGRPSFGICAYFPAGGAPANAGYFYGLAVYFGNGGQNGTNLASSYGPGNGLYHAADAYFPQIGRSNGGAGTQSATGFSGIHCVEAIPSATLDHIIVDGKEVAYSNQGQTPDVVGARQLTAPMYLIGGAGTQFGTPITIYSVWTTTNPDSVAIAQARTSSELARLQSLGVPLGIVTSNATDSTCAVDGTSIDQGYGAGTPTSALLNLDFPCTIHDFSQSGQPPMDMNFGFPDRAGRVFHPNAPRNIAYNGGVVNGVIAYLEPPQLALQDILNWNTQAHALGYKTIVSTMMSECSPGYNGESGDQLAHQFNTLLLVHAAEFDWVDNLAAWPQLGAPAACSGPAFVDGTHLNASVGQPLYVANERTAFEGVYASSLTTISANYTQLPSDRLIQATGSAAYSIQLIDANSASFNAAGKLCVQNTGAQPVTLLPVTGELIDAATTLSVAPGTTTCVRPIVLNTTTAGATWTAN
jgi:hypothetical protein